MSNTRKASFFYARISALILALAFLLSLSSCTINLVIGGNGSQNDSEDGSSLEELGQLGIDEPEMGVFEELAMLFKKGISAEEFLSYIEIVELTPENASDYITVGERPAPDGNSVDELDYVWRLKEGYLPLNTVQGTYTGIQMTEYKHGGTITSEQRDVESTLVMTVGTEEYFAFICEKYRYQGEQSCFSNDLEDMWIREIEGKIFKVNIPAHLWSEENKTVLRREGDVWIEKEVLYRTLKIKTGAWYEPDDYLLLSCPSDAPTHSDRIFSSAILKLLEER